MFENEEILKEILTAGNAKVRKEASIILKEVKEKLNLIQ